MAALALVAGACSSFSTTSRSSRSAPSPPVVTEPPCIPASLEDRAARVLIVGLPDITSPEDPLVADVAGVGVGGVLLTHANVESEYQVGQLVKSLRQQSRGPLLVTVDEEPGRVRTFQDLFGSSPSARRMAAQGTEADVEEDARTIARRLSVLGIDMNFAPVADIDDGPWNGIVGDRSFSGDPDQASRYALAYARGLTAGGVTPVIKHFPGHGRASDDSHFALPKVDEPLVVLRETDVRPFADAVAAGVPVVMMGHVAYDALEEDVPASVSRPAYELLRSLGFEGAAITDSIGMGAVNLRWNFDAAVVKAVAAGADGVLATDGRQSLKMRDALVSAVRDGSLDEARLNQAAGRMVALAGGDPQTVTCTTVDLPVLGAANGPSGRVFRAPDP